jgi:hypothetical protein
MTSYKEIQSRGVYKIRYNTKATSTEKCWRIMDSNNNEFLVDSVEIENSCITTKDWMDETQEYKFHITTKGVLYVDENNNAIIGN